MVRQFPRQFWVLFLGSTISAVGASLVFPFLALYMRQKLDLPMTTVGVVMGIRAITALPAQLVGGELVDRWGRRSLMIFSLLIVSLRSVGLGLANSLPQFVVLAIVGGVAGTMLSRPPTRCWPIWWRRRTAPELFRC